MRAMLVTVTFIPWFVAAVVSLPACAISTAVVDSVPLEAGVEAQALATILPNIEHISRDTRVRRDIAQAAFCLPQNVLAILFYGLLQLTGNVVNTADVNEIRIVVTTAPVGVSLGKYVFIHTSLQTENAIRHEYGHTLQGYKHGPFYLLFEGLVSFVQAAFSMISPSFAAGYFDRWPEDEANRLGGVTRIWERTP